MEFALYKLIIIIITDVLLFSFPLFQKLPFIWTLNQPRNKQGKHTVPISDISTSAILLWAVPWYNNPTPSRADTCTEWGRSSSAEVGGRRASRWILSTLVAVKSIVLRLNEAKQKCAVRPLKQKKWLKFLGTSIVTDSREWIWHCTSISLAR